MASEAGLNPASTATPLLITEMSTSDKARAVWEASNSEMSRFYSILGNIRNSGRLSFCLIHFDQSSSLQ